MLDQIKLKVTGALCLISLISACSIVGSWAYDNLDNYLNDYFLSFAKFSKNQEQEIESVTENFKYWLTAKKLIEIQSILDDIKALDNTSTRSDITLIYDHSYDIFQSVSSYFNSKFIIFSSSLNAKQIIEIENHFFELQEKREAERDKEESYQDRLLENYISVFKRLGVKLRKDQRDLLMKSIENIQDNSQEWNLLQQEWIKEMILILNKQEGRALQKNLDDHLNDLSELGSQNFQDRVQKNQTIGIIAITDIVSSMDENQFKKMNKTLSVFQKSILRIIKNQNEESSS